MEDIKDPRRTLPKAIILGLLIVTACYLLVNTAFILVLTVEDIKTSTLIVSSFSSQVAGFSVSVPLSLLVFLSLFGSMLGTGLINGRFCFAASRERHLPKFLSLLQKQSNTPVTAQIMNATISLVMISVTNR